jgi:aryl-alcohol dehydrogenase-like predicted oxidoreductase
MDRILLGDTDLLVSRLCLGGNVFGWTADESDSFAVLDAFYEAGGNFIDTADVYTNWHPGNSGGESERIIGRWLRSRQLTGEIVVATKGGMLAPNDGLSARAVTRAIDESLRRLDTTCIDLWYAHRDDPATPIDETARALDDAVRAGKVRHVAASSFKADRLAAALERAAELGAPSYRALQVRHNLLDRASLTDELAAVTARHRVAVVAYYALAAGVLTGKYDAANETTKRQLARVDSGRDRDRTQQVLDRPDTGRVLAVQRSVAQRHRMPAAAVAIAWLLAQPGVAVAVASARQSGQLSAILAGASLTLSAEDPAALGK